MDILEFIMVLLVVAVGLRFQMLQINRKHCPVLQWHCNKSGIHLNSVFPDECNHLQSVYDIDWNLHYRIRKILLRQCRQCRLPGLQSWFCLHTYNYFIKLGRRTLWIRLGKPNHTRRNRRAEATSFKYFKWKRNRAFSKTLYSEVYPLSSTILICSKK